MKNMLLLMVVCTFALAGCKKKSQPRPDFGVYGIQTVTLINDGYDVAIMPLTIAYSDNNNTDLREPVTLSVSGLPATVGYDTTWTHEGYPPYTTTLRLSATTFKGVMPGTYPLILTATSARMGTKQIGFLLNVVKAPSCAGRLLGRYDYCYSYCTGKSYADSVYEDPLLANKIWFSNFNGTGEPAYAILNCYSKYLTIPPQLINGVLYQGGSVCPYVREMSLYVRYGNTECTLTMH